MNVGELFVKIGLDMKDFNAALSGIESKLQGLEKFKGLNLNLNNVKGFADVTANVTQMRNALSSALPVAAQLKMRLQEQQTQFGVLSASLAETVSKYGATSQAAQKKELALQKLSNQINTTKAALSNLDSETVKTQAGFTRVAQSATMLQTALGTALGFVGGQVLTAAIGGISQAFGSAVQSAISFDQQMANIRAVLAPTADQFQQLNAMALELGATTAFSASEAASAIEILGTQGVSTDAILGGVLEATLSLAAATGSDLNTAATVASDAMFAFNLQAKDMGAVVDGITGVTVASKFTIDDYRLALANGGGAAAAFGVSLEEFNAVIAATSTQFNSGQTAGTAFRTFINRLTPSTNTAKDAMMQLGLVTADGTNVFYDASGALKSMPEVAGIVQKAFSGLTEESRAAYIEQIFGAEAIGTVIGLMQQGEAGVNNFAAAIGEISAADQAAERMNSLQGKLEELKGAFETLGITAISAFIPAIMNVVSAITDAINNITTFIQALQGSQDAFAQLPPAVQFVVSVIQNLGNYFSELASNASAWGAAIGSNFADGIISAAQAVVSALMEMGSIISYWLTPGSPPPLLPDLDTWGRDAAQVYVDSFSTADFSSLQTMGNIIKDILTGMFDSGSFAKQDIIPAVIGSREAFSRALDQLRETGNVGESSIQAIISAADDAGSVIEPLIRAFFNLEEITQDVAGAQEQLADAQNELNRVTAEYDEALEPIEKALEDIQEQEDKLERSERIKELQDQLNGVGDSAESALDPLNKQMRALKRQQKGVELDQEIAKYKEQLNDTNPEVAQAAALKLSELELEKQTLALEAQIDIEKEREAARQKEIDDKKAVLELERLRLEEQQATLEQERDTAIEVAQTRVDAAQTDLDNAIALQTEAQKLYELEKARIDSIKEQNVLLQEQLKMMEETAKSGGGGGGGMSAAAKEAEAARKAQEQYNYNLADTDGKLAILKERLAGVKEGSAEYYQILGQINTLETQKANESAKAADAAAKDALARKDAEFQYAMQTTDTAGKLALLRGKLGEVEEGSVEYYQILGQIAGLEAQAAREAEKLAKGTASAGGAAGIAKPEFADLAGNVDDLNGALGDNAGASTNAANSYNVLSSAQSGVATSANTFQGIMAGMNPILAPIQGMIQGIGNALTQFFAPTMAAIGPQIDTFKGAISNFGGVLMQVFQNEGPQWVESFKNAWAALSPLFEGLSLTVAVFVTGTMGFISSLVSGAAGMLPGLGTAFTGVVQVIEGGFLLIGVFLENLRLIFTSILQGDWSAVWLNAQKIVSDTSTAIGTLIQGLVNIGIGLIQGLVGGVLGLFAGMYTAVTGQTTTFVQDVNNWFSGMASTVQMIIQDLVNGFIQWFTDLYNEMVGHSIIPDMVTAIIEYITTMKDEFFRLIGELVGLVLEAITTFAGNALTAITTWVTDTLTQAGKLKDDFITYASDLAAQVFDYITTLAGDGLSAITTWVSDMVSKFTDLKNDAGKLAQELADDVIGFITEIPGKIDQLARQFVEAGKGIVSNIQDGFEGAIEGFLNEVKAKIQAIKDMLPGSEPKDHSSPLYGLGQSGRALIENFQHGINSAADIQLPFNNLAATMPQIPIPAMNTGMIMPATGASYTIYMDLRGSTLTETQVDAIVSKRFTELGKQLAIAGTI